MLNPKHVRRRFERAAETFDGADFVHAKTREGLLARLEPLVVDAKTVVDLGAATGAANAVLDKRFSKARVVAVDLAHAMLQKARKRKAWRQRISFAQADAAALPFADHSIDVVFSNQLLPWVSDIGAVFSEVARVLRKDGVFAFATLGPDSLQALSQAWRNIDNDAHVLRFADMHDLGDALVRAGLRDPVLDIDRLAVRYAKVSALFNDLTASGARNMQQHRRSTLTGKRRFAALTEALEATHSGTAIELDLELVFGHCWGAGPLPDASDYRIDATQIPIRRN